MITSFFYRLSGGVFCLLMILGLINTKSVLAQNDPNYDLKLQCYEVMQEGAFKELGYQVPESYDVFLSKARKIDSKHTSFATHITEPLFRFEQYRHGRKLFKPGDNERLYDMIEMKPDAPSVRFQEFEVNFLSSYDPKSDREYLEYCGVRIIEQENKANPLFGISQDEFGMMDMAVYHYLNDLSREGSRFKVAHKTRNIRSTDMSQIGTWKTFTVYPKTEGNDFYNLYEMSYYLKELFDQRQHEINFQVRNGDFHVVQAADPQKNIPEIKEDKRSGIRLINGVVSSLDQLRATNTWFQQRLILTGKNIAPYLSMAIYEDEEQRETWRDFQNGLISKPNINSPKEAPALPHIQEILNGTQDSMEDLIMSGGECFTNKQRKNFEKDIQALDEKYGIQKTEIEEFPGQRYKWPEINLQRGMTLKTETFNQYTKDRWDIEKKFRDNLKKCLSESQGVKGCKLTPEEIERMNEQTARYEKNIKLIRGYGMETSEKNEKISILMKKYKKSIESITSKCSKFLQRKAEEEALAKQFRKSLIKGVLISLPIVFALIFGGWYMIYRKRRES